MIIAFYATFSAVTFDASADDWPTWAHDVKRSGVTDERLSPPLSLRWIFRSPAPPAEGWARPVNGYGAVKYRSNVDFDDAPQTVADATTAYFNSTAENKIYAIDAAAGRIRWEFYLDAPPRAAPTLYQGKLYFGADDGCVYCISADDGRAVWRLDCAPTDEQMLGCGRIISVWPVRTDVVIAKGVAYFAVGLFPSEGVYLYAVDAATGRVIWRRDMHLEPGDCPSPQGYLPVDGDSLYLPSRVAPVRRSLVDGSPIPLEMPITNHEHRFHIGGSRVRLWEENLVFGSAAIIGYDPAAAWTDKWGKPKQGVQQFLWFGAREAISNDETAYLATDDHLIAVPRDRLAALSENECKAFEESYKKHRVASYLTALEALEEAGADSPRGRKLQETSLHWGREQFERWPTEAAKHFARFKEKCNWMATIRATDAMILSGDILYAGGEDFVVAVDGRTGRELWRDKTSATVRGLAIAAGRLYVTTTDGNVRCYAAAEKETKVKEISPVTSPDKRQWYLNDTDKPASGYALFVGCEDEGEEALNLARLSETNVYIVEPDPARVAAASRKISSVGMLGNRITVQRHQLETLPFPPYLFDIVSNTRSSKNGNNITPREELERVTRPGGVIQYNNDSGSTYRKYLDGAADWTHNYATAANTYCNEDSLVKGPLGISWFGRPGPRDRIDRHATGPMPLVVGSRMFLTGYDTVSCYDIYDGEQHWKRTILGATRTGLPLGTSNLAVNRDGLYLVVNDRHCERLLPATGETKETFYPPERSDDRPAFWGWIATADSLLFGSRAMYDERRKKADQRRSDAVFAIDYRSGETLWNYDSADIDHDGIAVDDGKVFFVDRNLTDDERRQAVRLTFSKDENEASEHSESVDRHGKQIPPDLRKIVVLDARSGNVLWQRPVDLTDITLDDTIVSDGRVGVACMVKDGVLVVHGTGSLGHPYREFLSGKFSRRAIYAFDVASGRPLWGGRKNYRKRPIIVGSTVYAEPHAWDLRTGRQIKYTHPISDRAEPVNLFRGYIGCSHLLASANTIFGNIEGIGYRNLDSRAGYASFRNMSLACGIGAVPAGGVYVAPEGRSGCTCATPIYTSIAFYPRGKSNIGTHRYALGIPGGTASPIVRPVQKVAINLGAPGLSEDDDRNLWIAYPVPKGRDVTGIVGDFLPTYAHDDSMCYRFCDNLLPIAETSIPWIYASGYKGTKPLEFRLIDDGDSPAKYTVRLHFAEPKKLTERRIFDVLLQGKVVTESVDIAADAGGVRKALVKEYRGVEVSDKLVIQLRPTDTSPIKSPVLCGIEATRE